MKGLILYLFVVIMIVALYGFAYSMDFGHTKDSIHKNTKIGEVTNGVSTQQIIK